MEGDTLHIARNKRLQYNKLLLSPDETCEAIGVKRATLFKLLASGEIRSIKIGRLRRIPVDCLRRYVERQVEEQTGAEEER